MVLVSSSNLWDDPRNNFFTVIWVQPYWIILVLRITDEKSVITVAETLPFNCISSLPDVNICHVFQLLVLLKRRASSKEKEYILYLTLSTLLLQTVKIKRNYTTYLFQQLVLKINTSVIFAIRHLNFLHQKSVHITIAIIPFSEIQETTHKENKALSEKKSRSNSYNNNICSPGQQCNQIIRALYECVLLTQANDALKIIIRHTKISPLYPAS